MYTRICMGYRTKIRCNLVFYCGRDHQLADWKAHKIVCKKKGGDTSKGSTTDGSGTITSMNDMD